MKINRRYLIKIIKEEVHRVLGSKKLKIVEGADARGNMMKTGISREEADKIHSKYANSPAYGNGKYWKQISAITRMLGYSAVEAEYFLDLELVSSLAVAPVSAFTVAKWFKEAEQDPSVNTEEMQNRIETELLPAIARVQPPDRREFRRADLQAAFALIARTQQVT